LEDQKWFNVFSNPVTFFESGVFLSAFAEDYVLAQFSGGKGANQAVAQRAGNFLNTQRPNEQELL
jgi:hypothetical protein